MFDDQSISITCRSCGKETRKKLAWLKTHDKLVCPGCKAVIRLEAKKALAAIDRAEKSALRALGKTIKLGKR